MYIWLFAVISIIAYIVVLRRKKEPLTVMKYESGLDYSGEQLMFNVNKVIASCVDQCENNVDCNRLITSHDKDPSQTKKMMGRTFATPTYASCWYKTGGIENTAAIPSANRYAWTKADLPEGSSVKCAKNDPTTTSPGTTVYRVEYDRAGPSGAIVKDATGKEKRNLYKITNPVATESSASIDCNNYTLYSDYDQSLGGASFVDQSNYALSSSVRYIKFTSSLNIVVISQLQVFSGTMNIATKGLATASTTDPSTNAGNAIDGVAPLNRVYGATPNLFLTTGQADDYWQLDLLDSYNIDRIVYYGRAETDFSMFTNLQQMSLKMVLQDEFRNVLLTIPFTNASKIITFDFDYPTPTLTTEANWTVNTQNRYLDSNSMMKSTKTANECKSQCVQTSGCQGFTFTRTNAAGAVGDCSLVNSTAGMSLHPLSDAYKLTVPAVFNGLNSNWTTEAGYAYSGGDQGKSIIQTLNGTTVQACAPVCSSNDKCLGIMFDKVEPTVGTCYLLSEMSGKYSSQLVDSYKYTPPPPMTSAGGTSAGSGAAPPPTKVIFTPASATESATVGQTNNAILFAASTADSMTQYLDISPGINFGASPFTIETYFKTGPVLDNGFFLGAGADKALSVNIFSPTEIIIDGFQIDATIFVLPTTLQVNTWYHLAVARDASNNETVWLNGARATSAYNRWNTSTTYGPVFIDTRNYDGNTTGINGSTVCAHCNGNFTLPTGVDFSGVKLTNFRVVVGSALYDPNSATITPPATPLTNVANTKLLLKVANAATAFVDSSGTQTITGGEISPVDVPGASGGTPSGGTADTPSGGTADTPSSGTADTPSSGTGGTPSGGTGGTPSGGTGGTPSGGTGDTPSGGTGDTPSGGTGDTPSGGTGDTAGENPDFDGGTHIKYSSGLDDKLSNIGSCITPYLVYSNFAPYHSN